jgi:hypothetical protein
MKNGSSIFKSLVPAIIVAMFFLWFKGCNCNGSGKATRDTISVKVETIKEVIRHDTSYVPKERKINVPSFIHDTLETTEYITQKVDTAKILKDYNSTRFYFDTLNNKYGSIIITDTVRHNQLVGRGIQTNLGMITTIKTYTVTEKKRNVVYVGAGLLGSPTSPLYGTEINLDLKNKSGKIYEIGAVLLRGGDLYYTVGLKWPIHLTKK